MARSRGAGARAARVVVWLAAFGAATYLLRGWYSGGSLPVGAVALALAATAATVCAAAVRYVTDTTRGDGSIRAGGGAGAASVGRAMGRVAAGLFGAVVAFAAAVVTWSMSGSAYTGCLFDCDDGARSPVGGAVLGLVTVGLCVGAARLAVWGLDAGPRARTIATRAAGAVGALAAVALPIGLALDSPR